LCRQLRESKHPLKTWFCEFEGDAEDIPDGYIDDLLELVQDPMITLIEEVEKLEQSEE
jgi:hypothetical protein